MEDASARSRGIDAGSDVVRRFTCDFERQALVYRDNVRCEFCRFDTGHYRAFFVSRLEALCRRERDCLYFWRAWLYSLYLATWTLSCIAYACNIASRKERWYPVRCRISDSAF